MRGKMSAFLPLCFTYLVEKGQLSLSQMIEKMTINPARVLGIDRGTLVPGAVADVTVFDPNTEWEIDLAKFQSKSRNCPYQGWKVKGKPMATVVGGEVRMSRLR